MILVRAAARNNAHWCHIVAGLHQSPGLFEADAWTAAHRTPPYYPDAVTLVPGASAEAVLARIDTGPGCSVKDSFADLDLASAGFRVLFDARWLHRRAGPPDGVSAGRLSWRQVRDPAELGRWERAWGGGEETGRFRPGLLDDASVAVFGGYAGDDVMAGAVANRTGDVVGLSNVYAADGDLDATWRGCLAAVAAHFPGLPMVGYEQGDALAPARRNGFAEVGPLRVWLREGAEVPPAPGG